MKYIGATSSFIKLPFIIEGIIMGLASAIITWIVVTLGYTTAYIYLPKVGAELGVFGFIGYSSMWYIILISFVVLGVFLGGVGSSLATNKYLKEFKPSKINIKKDDGKKDKTSKKQEQAALKLKRENLKREALEKEQAKKEEKKEFERKRKARRLTVIMLICLVVSPINSLFATSTEDKIDEIDKQSKEATEKYEQVQEDIKVFEDDIKELDEKVQDITNEVDALNKKVETAKAAVERIAEELQNVSTNYEATEQLLNTRLRVLYENGFVSLWEVLLSAESVTDFVAKYNVMATIIENDQKNLKAMQDQKKYIQNLKESAEIKRLQVEQAEYDVEKSKEALEAAKLNKENKLGQLEKSKEELKQLLADLKAERKKQEQKLAEERAAAGNSNLVFNGQFTWPVPGVYYVTAIFRDSEYYDELGLMHYGTDIAKGGGATIVAAQSGKVISSGWSNYGYGNYIQIDHGKSEDGNRYVTLYAHLASRYVKVGDYVAKGQEIGYMGTTGFSTGVHLHFEIIKNGVQINAMNYYPELAGKAVYYSYGRWISFPFSNMAKYQR